jgi:hypothetical protein
MNTAFDAGRPSLHQPSSVEDLEVVTEKYYQPKSVFYTEDFHIWKFIMLQTSIIRF